MRVLCFSSIASGYYGASLPFDAFLAPFWLQPGSLGPHMGTLGVSLGTLFDTLFSTLFCLWASPGLSWVSLEPLLGLLEPLRACPGTFLEDDRSWITFWALLSHFLEPKSDAKIAFVRLIYGFRF